MLAGDAGDAARGDQAGPLDREGPRGAAGEGARRTRSGSWSRRTRTSSGWRGRKRSSTGRRKRPTASSPRPNSRPRDARAEAESYVDAQARAVRDRVAPDPRGGADPRRVRWPRRSTRWRWGATGSARPTTAAEQEFGADAGGPAVRRGGGAMTIEPIDVRDLIGHPGISRLAHVGGTLEGLGTEVATLQDRRARPGRPAARVGGRGHPRHRAPRRHVRAALRAMPEGLRAAGPRRRARAVLDGARGRRRGRVSPRRAKGGSTPSRWCATRSAWSCRSRRCTARTVWAVQRLRRRPQPRRVPGRSPTSRSPLGRPRARAPRAGRPN